MFVLGCLIPLLHASDPGAAAQLARRCAACPPVFEAAVRLLMDESASGRQASGPSHFLATMTRPYDPTVIKPVRVQGLAGRLAAGLACARAAPHGALLRARLLVLAAQSEVCELSAAEAAAVPGALPALVRLLNSGDRDVRRDAARTIAAVARYCPDAHGALLRLPTLTAMVSLLRRDGAAGECVQRCSTCWAAVGAAGALTAVAGEGRREEAARALAALLLSAPGALAAVARQLGAYSAPDYSAVCFLYLLDSLGRGASGSGELRWRTSAAALPALLPAAARALALSLEADSRICFQAYEGGAVDTRETTLAAALEQYISGWLSAPTGSSNEGGGEQGSGGGTAASPAERRDAAARAVLNAAPGLLAGEGR
ncbi:MAG: hypothetical protein J3K34DRAFT_496160 [Monoraphidium minutum]|nr:MAG: hypothetical protein J3K34DRAFT_496160 [Monoraphidium minutum]